MAGKFSEALAGRYEELFSMLLDAIPSSIVLIDRRMRIVLVNRNFLEKSKRSSSNTIGRHVEDVFPSVIIKQMEMKQRIRQAFEKNQPTSGGRMTYRVPGLPISIYYYRILPFSCEGVVENVIILMDDVTEQVRLSEDVRRMELHLASVVESASDIVLSTDTEGNILTWNTAAEKISGYSLGEVKERHFYEFFSEESQKEIKSTYHDIGVQHRSHTAEWDLVTKQGGAIPVHWILSPMKYEQAGAGGIVAVGRDLTERRKFERQLLQTQKLAALGVMAGGIAHEIRNPLAICSSAAQFLKKSKNTTGFQRECSEKIHRGIHRASIIIENLLRFARPPEEAEVAEVDLRVLLEEAYELIANQAKIQKIEMITLFPKEPVLMRGVASLLQQVFINFFLNSINAMPDGGTLEILFEKKDGEGLICVKDTGKGIAEKDIDKIFDPFFTTEQVGKGTGLGLSICYSIVKQHFGNIEVESVEGKGSTFLVRLPIL